MPKMEKEIHEKKTEKEAGIEDFQVEFEINKTMAVLIGVLAFLLIFNQFLLADFSFSGYSVKNVDISEISQITTTSQAVALLFPVEDIQNEEDAINIMISQGTPEYGSLMGISFDNPVGALELLASNYNTVKQDIKQNYPDVWERYLNLATKPVGVSCEFCCGVGPVGITKNGDLRCGCKHNPAAQTLAMLLMKDTKYDDAEVLREVLRWKSLWFPRDMVGLALKASGGDIETALPGMVGGC